MEERIEEDGRDLIKEDTQGDKLIGGDTRTGTALGERKIALLALSRSQSGSLC
jgi:hypothetical protein